MNGRENSWTCRDRKESVVFWFGCIESKSDGYPDGNVQWAVGNVEFKTWENVKPEV